MQDMMCMVEVSHLAKLARIGLEQKEMEHIQKDLEGILDYISQLKNFSLESEETSGYLPKDVVREDRNPHESGFFTDKILENAPEKEKGFIRVKKIL